jgi:transcription antitermination protein NusB
MSASAPPEPSVAPPRAGRRSLARLAAVQALYQIELTDAVAGTVITEFAAHRLGKEIDGERYADADQRFFAELVGDASGHRDEVDGIIASALPPEWPLERLERVLRAILRLGTFELCYRSDVPARVVISEYLEIAHAFFEGKEPGMVNAVLDRVGQVLRPSELLGPSASET